MDKILDYQLIELVSKSQNTDIYRAINPDKKSVILKLLKDENIDSEKLARFKKEYEIIQLKNEVSRARQKVVVEQGKFEVRMWEAYLASPAAYVNKSRYVRFGLGVAKSIISLLILASNKRLPATPA